MPAKMATLGFLEIKVLWKEVHDVITYTNDTTIKILSDGSNYIVDADVTKFWLLQHFYEISYHNLSFIRIWPEKNTFLRSALGSKFNNLELELGMALKCYISLAKRVKTKSLNRVKTNIYPGKRTVPSDKGVPLTLDL